MSLRRFSQESQKASLREFPKHGSPLVLFLLLGRFERNAVIERFERSASFDKAQDERMIEPAMVSLPNHLNGLNDLNALRYLLARGIVFLRGRFSA